MNKTFAVLSYPNSNNLGDFIQSEAVKQYFKNQIIQELDRDQLHIYKGPKVFVFMNGWFMEKPSNWPPSNNINPFFVSFHLNPTSKKRMLSKTGVKYLKKHQPIGCRDTYTQKILSNCGIESYFSACLTLTLKRDNFVPKNTRRQGILVISPMERLISKNFDESRFTLKTVFNKIKTLKKNRQYSKAMKRLNFFLSKQKDPAYFKSQLLDPKKFSEKERSNEAIKQLKDIARAKLVITSRIHTALPAVAFGTPVLFISDGLEHINQKSRLQGMELFFPILNSKDLNKWIFKWPNPAKSYLTFAKKLEKQISHFIKD